MKALKENANGLLMCLFEVLVGVLLLINPLGFTTGIIMGAGILLILFGLGCIIRYFRTDAAEAAKSQNLLKGLVLLLGGGFCMANSYWFVATFPLLTIIYGVMIVVTGLGKVQWTVDALRLKKKWGLPAVSAVISLVCGAVILSSPFTTTAVLWQFTAISLIVEAVFDMVALFIGKKKNGPEKAGMSSAEECADGASGNETNGPGAD